MLLTRETNFLLYMFVLESIKCGYKVLNSKQMQGGMRFKLQFNIFYTEPFVASIWLFSACIIEK